MSGRTPTSTLRPSRPLAGPGRVLVPVVIGLVLLAWALELGQRRPRARVADPGGPLVEVPAAPAGAPP